MSVCSLLLLDRFPLKRYGSKRYPTVVYSCQFYWKTQRVTVRNGCHRGQGKITLEFCESVLRQANSSKLRFQRLLCQFLNLFNTSFLPRYPSAKCVDKISDWLLSLSSPSTREPSRSVVTLFASGWLERSRRCGVHVFTISARASWLSASC